MMVSVDQGWAQTDAAVVAPANSFDMAFDAASNTSYHVWVRARAAGNSKYNDSVYLQFSDAIDANGAALFATGTRNGLVVNLATESTGGGLNGWGWQDGAYWLSQSTTVRFASSGTHTASNSTRLC
jgi:hypothetical protein